MCCLQVLTYSLPGPEYRRLGFSGNSYEYQQHRHWGQRLILGVCDGSSSCCQNFMGGSIWILTET